MHSSGPSGLEVLGMLSPIDTLLNATPVLKLTLTATLVAIAVVVVAALARRRDQGRSELLSVVGLIGLLMGLLGALYSGLNIALAIRATHTTNLLVVLPSLMEPFYSLLLGVLAWTIAWSANRKASRTMAA